MRDWKVFIRKEETMKYYQQSKISGNPVRVEPKLEAHFGYTVDPATFDLQTLEREVLKMFKDQGIMITSITRKDFLGSDLSKRISVEITFVDKDSVGSSLMI